jgi:uncharacterized LabA/DUF88 family protein
MKKNIIIGGKDRSYYRNMSHNELREQADYGINVDWKELAIALTERLDTIRAEVYAECEE